MEAPTEETPSEAPVAPSFPPASMETGGAGDGPSWAEQMEAGEEEPFQRSRLAKCPHSQSRRCEPTSRVPFPLQDSEGRFASIAQLYKHAAAQPAAPHNVVGWGIMHLHPDLLPKEATRLGNQVACMIAEYHLTASAHQLSLCLIIPHEVAPLLPPLKNYVPGVSFEGTRDVRAVRPLTSPYATSKCVALANEGKWIRWTRPPRRASRKKLSRGVRASRRSKSVSRITRLNSGRSHQRAVPPVTTVRSTMVHRPRWHWPL